MFVLADLPIDPNVIIVFGAMIFAAIKAFLEKRQKAREEHDAPPETFSDSPPARDFFEEIQREFGNPERVEQPPTQAQVSQPISVTPPPLKKPADTPLWGQDEPIKRPTLSADEKKALANFERTSSEPPRAKRRRSTTQANVLKSLQSPSAAREALLLAEILGPPKALEGE